MATLWDGLVYTCGCIFLMMVAMGAISLVLYFVRNIRDFIDLKRWRFNIQRRYGIKPTAKCFCIDCIYHNNDNGYCCEFEKYTVDYGFCWGAKPVKKRNDISDATNDPGKKKEPFDFDKEN